ncbi:MAG: DHH family phosphoesterase [Candidatus Micrarchaeia archaeon]
MKHLFEDEGLRKLEQRFKKMAAFLEKTLVERKPVLLEYHDDGDGVFGALIVKKALEEKAALLGVPLSLYCLQSSSSAYSEEDARRDACQHELRAPLLLVVDFGLNEDSEKGVELARRAGFAVAAIDHHPFPKKIEGHYDCIVAPQQEGLGPEYCAGLLCFEVASAMGCAPSQEWARAALKSDNSRFMREEDDLLARAVDYLLIASKQKKPLSFYERVLEDRRALKEYYARAVENVMEMLEKAVKTAKIVAIGDNASAVLLDLEKCGCAKNVYPSKGKAVNEAHNKFSLELGGAVVTLGFTRDRISFRANAEAMKRGAAANPVIAELKKEFGSTIVSGGGHDVAAALKVRGGSARLVALRFAELVGKQLRRKAN